MSLFLFITVTVFRMNIIYYIILLIAPDAVILAC